MSLKIKLSDCRLQIFHEGRKRRVLVGELIYVKQEDHYELIYDKNYMLLRSAIALGPHLDLFKRKHISKKGELFSIFNDRIPVRENPAYEDYCYSQGISLDEKNPIILLGTIGKRGPSTFIFERVYESEFSSDDVIKFRENLKISQYDFAQAFDINKVTLQRIEAGASVDINTMKRLAIYLEFPEVALWQLKQTGGKIHSNVLLKLNEFFTALVAKTKK